MKFTQTATAGKCRRMRCKNPAAETICGYEICAEHKEETLTFLGKTFSDPPGGPDPELLEAFETFEIESQDDYMTAVSVMHDAINGREADDNARKAAGKPHYEPWKAVNESWKGCLGAWDSLIEAVKARIVAAKEAQERAQDAAMSRGLPLPPALEDPPGVSLKQEIQIQVANLNLVPEELLKAVVDTDAVLERIAQSPKESIPGLMVTRRYVVNFRRPSEDK